MRHACRRVAAAFALTLATLAALPARAEAPLADRLPQDTLVYLGWKGADGLGASYDKSHLKGMIDALNVRQLIDDIMTQAATEAGADPKKLEGLKLFSSLSNDIFRYPSAFYFGGVQDPAAEKPMPKLALIIKAGKDNATRLAEQLTQAIKTNPNPDAPAAANVIGDHLLVTVGDAKNAATFAALLSDKTTVAPLSAKNEFKAALTHTLESPAAIAYVDGTGILKLIDDSVAKAGAREKENWAKLADGLGVDSIRYAAFAGNFDGQNWTSRGFVSLAERRTGIVQFMDNAPLSQDALKLIPKSATWAGVIRFNGDKLLADVRNAAARMDDRGAESFDAGMKMFTNFTGIDLQKDLFASLGDEWVYYGTPDAVGNSLKGFTVACKLKDAQLAEKALSDVETFVAGLAAQRGGDQAKFATEKSGDLSMHIISWKGDNPGAVAWAVANGNLYFSLTPQGVQAAVDHAARKNPGIDENPAFAALIKEMGDCKFSSFAFADLPNTAPENYSLITQLVERAQRENPDIKVKLSLPAYEKLKPHMAPAGSFFWSDKDGWHLLTREPFPGAPVFGGGQTALQAMILQSAQTARQRATSAASANNLKSIGVATAAYAAEKGGDLPPDLGALVKANYITPNVVTRTPAARRADFAAMTEEQKAAWVKENAEYVYIGKGKAADAGADTIIAHEKYAPGTSRKVYALFGDYSVRQVEISEIEKKK